jgi:hypothetical protein
MFAFNRLSIDSTVVIREINEQWKKIYLYIVYKNEPTLLKMCAKYYKRENET